MQNIAGFDFVSLAFDENGQPTSSADLQSLTQRAVTASDVIFLAHGFRNTEQYATDLYTQFLANFRTHFQRAECHPLASCDFVVAGVYWPSMAVPEAYGPAGGSTQSLDQDTLLLATLRSKLTELKTAVPAVAEPIDQAILLLPHLNDDGNAQNRFTQLVLSAVTNPEADPTEGLDSLRNQDGATVLQKLSAPVILSIPENPDFDTGGVQSLTSSFYSVLGGAGEFINLASWWVMKDRSGNVGANGVAQSVRSLAASKPSLKIHLVGHSLGGRLVASCAKSLAQDPRYQPASVTLLEAAFSHFGFSADNGSGTPGFFRDVIAKSVSKGPLVATFSAQDSVVGTTYSLASRLVGDNVKAIGDSTDPYGGIGHNGAVNTVESTFSKLKKAGAPDGSPYQFKLGVVNCLDGSGGLIKDHLDVTNQDVTYAFACCVAVTQSASATAS